MSDEYTRLDKKHVRNMIKALCQLAREELEAYCRGGVLEEQHLTNAVHYFHHADNLMVSVGDSQSHRKEEIHIWLSMDGLHEKFAHKLLWDRIQSFGK